MKVIQTLRMDLARCGCTPLVGAVQGEANTRTLVVSLYDNGIAWEIPEAAVVDIAFKKPDGTQGIYSKLPDGSDATTFTGNVLTATLAPQVLTCAGRVQAAFIFHKDGEQTLATFPFAITVTASPAEGAERSEDYYNPTISDIEAAVNAIQVDVEYFADGVRNAEASATAAQASATAAQASAEAAVAEAADAKAAAETAVADAADAKAAAETAGANATAAGAAAQEATAAATAAAAAATAAQEAATEAAKEAVKDLTAEDLDAVPKTRKINGKDLSDDISLTADDVGAATEAYADSLFTGYKGQVTSSENLDDLTEDGVYYFDTGDVPSNAPFENASIIHVFGAPADLNKKIQVCIRYGVTGSMAIRSKSGSGWQGWSHYATQDAVDGKAGKFTKIWTNGSPANGYAENTLTLDLSSGNWLMIVYRSHKGHAYFKRDFLPVSTGTEGRLRMEANGGGGYYRTVTVSKTGSSGTVSISAASKYDDSVTSNDYCVPYQIFIGSLT